MQCIIVITTKQVKINNDNNPNERNILSLIDNENVRHSWINNY